MDLKRIGVVNQTTMLASDTQAIADFLKTTILEKEGKEEQVADKGIHFVMLHWTTKQLCKECYSNRQI